MADTKGNYTMPRHIHNVDVRRLGPVKTGSGDELFMNDAVSQCCIDFLSHASFLIARARCWLQLLALGVENVMKMSGLDHSIYIGSAMLDVTPYMDPNAKPRRGDAQARYAHLRRVRGLFLIMVVGTAAEHELLLIGHTLHRSKNLLFQLITQMLNTGG